MDKNDPQVGTGLVGAPACGDVMKLQLRITDNGVIEDAIQNFWLRLCHCVFIVGDRVGQRQNCG